jgi:hypothetical protein
MGEFSHGIDLAGAIYAIARSKQGFPRYWPSQQFANRILPSQEEAKRSD